MLVLLNHLDCISLDFVNVDKAPIVISPVPVSALFSGIGARLRIPPGFHKRLVGGFRHRGTFLLRSEDVCASRSKLDVESLCNSLFEHVSVGSMRASLNVLTSKFFSIVRRRKNSTSTRNKKNEGNCSNILLISCFDFLPYEPHYIITLQASSIQVDYIKDVISVHLTSQSAGVAQLFYRLPVP